jgi:hypothetical protein
MPTERVLQFLEEKGMETGINRNAWSEALLLSSQTFPIES